MTTYQHPTNRKLESWLVTAGRSSEPGAPLNVPLVPASNFIIGRGREYSRDDGTPTWQALEEIVEGLDPGRAVAFASGIAAIAAVCDQLAAGSTAVLPDDCCQGVAGLVSAGAERGRWTVRRMAVHDTVGWIDACRTADLVWLESPSNPLLGVADLQAICAAPRKSGAVSLNAVPNLYFAMPVNPTVAVGIGLTAPWGLVTEYDNGWIGRFQAIKSSIKTYNLNPAVSWKAADNLALGLGFNVQRLEGEFTNQVNYSAALPGAAGLAVQAGQLPAAAIPGIAAATPRLESGLTIKGSDNAYGWNVGLLCGNPTSSRASGPTTARASAIT